MSDIVKLEENPQDPARNEIIAKLNEIIDFLNKPVRQPRRKTAKSDSKKS